MHRRDQDSGPGDTEWVPQCDRPSAGVTLAHVQVEILSDCTTTAANASLISMKSTSSRRTLPSASAFQDVGRFGV